jgi:Domain of unknown function (DUF4878)
MSINRSIKLSCVALSVVMLLWACGGAGNAEAVAERFLNAMATGDLPTAKKYATPEAQASLDMMASTVEAKKANPSKIEAIAAEENGDKARVSYTEDGIVQHIDLIKAGGEWKVAWTKGTGGGAALEELGTQLEEAMDNAIKADTLDSAATL